MEVGRQTGDDDLENLLGLLEVFEAVLAEIAECDVWGKLLTHESPCHVRQEDLPAMASREEPRNAVEGRAEVITVALLGGADVEGHANA